MGKLAIIPTPIGNLEDITLRAIRYLREADLILAEDTRTSAKLLQHLSIERPLQSYHKFNEHQVVAHVATEIKAGKRVVLISDAGTPGISDPGFLLVRHCIEAGIEVECLPGATAFVPALVASGLPTDRFYFEGFLPHKKGRLSRLQSMLDRDVTTVLYESPNRIVKLLQQLSELIGDERQVVIAREISKVYEEYLRGVPSKILTHFEAHPPLGEMVVLLSPKEKEERQHTNKYKPYTD